MRLWLSPTACHSAFVFIFSRRTSISCWMSSSERELEITMSEIREAGSASTPSEWRQRERDGERETERERNITYTLYLASITQNSIHKLECPKSKQLLQQTTIV